MVIYNNANDSDDNVITPDDNVGNFADRTGVAGGSAHEEDAYRSMVAPVEMPSLANDDHDDAINYHADLSYHPATVEGVYEYEAHTPSVTPEEVISLFENDTPPHVVVTPDPLSHPPNNDFNYIDNVLDDQPMVMDELDEEDAILLDLRANLVTPESNEFGTDDMTISQSLY